MCFGCVAFSWLGMRPMLLVPPFVGGVRCVVGVVFEHLLEGRRNASDFVHLRESYWGD